jgi:hypothetical protein
MGRRPISDECLTLAESADRLTRNLAKPYTAADVLQLGLEDRLVLSVRFLSSITLTLCNLATPSENPKKATRSRHLGQRRTNTGADIWDLPLVGSEYQAVRDSIYGHRQSVLGQGPAYVTSRDGEMWEVPFPGLGHPCEFVVRIQSLAEFEADEGASSQDREALLGTREKRTLLTFIAAACRVGKVNLAEHGVQKKIIDAADMLGVRISAATVSSIVKEVRQAVEDRQP